MTPLMHALQASFTPPLPLALMAAAAWLVLPLLLLAPRAALARRGGERAWFGFVVRCQLFLVAALFLGLPLVLELGLERAWVTDGALRGPVPGFPAWAPTALVALVHLCAAAFTGRHIGRLLRGTRGAATSVLATVQSLLAGLSPILGLSGALVAIRHQEWRAAVMSVVAGFGLGLWVAMSRSRVRGLSPEAVTAGPLRERVFALAERAGVSVAQLLVLAARDARLMNAFALQGRRVLITDTLLEQLSRREVDSVIAHELAHLRFRHPQLLFASLVVTVAVVFPLSLPLGTWSFALTGVVGWLVLLMLSRSLEWVADRQAVAWTGDAEALITAIARISRSNDIPLDWGPWTGLVLSHPPARARALALARSGTVSAERAEHLLVSPPEDPDRWPCDLDSATPIAGSAVRMRAQLATAWGSWAGAALAATLVVQLARLSPTSWPAAVLLPAGVAAAWLVMLVTFDQLAVGSYRAWRRSLATRLAADDSAWYVGLSPGSQPRLYEGFSDWDVGFLSVDSRGLRYQGERACFTLRREHVGSIELVPGLPGWIAAPRVAIGWRGKEGAEHVFTLRAGDARAVHELKAANTALANELRRALEAPGSCLIAMPPAGLPPEPAQVTGQDPWRVAGWRTLPALAAPLALLAYAAALLGGLPFWLGSGPGALEVFASVSCAALVMRLPLLGPHRRIVAEPRVLDRAA